jgi:restriction endonuclease S subunit
MLGSRASMPEWVDTTLGEVADFASGYAFPPKHQGGIEGTPFFKVSDMNTPGNEVWLSAAANRVTDEVLSQTRARVHPAGTVVFAKVGAALATEKRRLLAQPSAFDNNVMGLVAKPSVLPEYLYNFMLTVRLGALAQPGAVPSVNQSHLRRIQLELPPLPVQKRIIEIVGAIDEQVAALEIEAESLLRVRNATLGDILFRGGEGWSSAPLSEAGTLTRGRRFVKSDYVESGLGCIHYGQIYTDYGASATRTVTYLPESFRGSMRLAQSGDVVIAGTSENVDDVGKAVAWVGDDDVAVHDDCFIFRHNHDPRYVSYFFASPLFQHEKRRFTSETKVVRISAASLKKIVMPIPPRDEQERISRMADAMDAQVVALRAEAEYLRQARVTLLTGLLSRTIKIEFAELEV